MTVEAAQEVAWQQRVILASRSIAASMTEEERFDVVDLFGPIDNTSRQCLHDELCDCSHDKPLWWLVLRWWKLLVFRLARSYHAKPFLLAVFPLLLGLVVGYFLGLQAQHTTTRPLSTSRRKDSIWKRCRKTALDLVAHLGVSLHLFLTGSSGETNDTLYKPPAIKNFGQNKTAIDDTILRKKEGRVRSDLKSDRDTLRESGVHPSKVPQHVAVIMDGNRRYGKAKYGDVSKGHWEGSSKLVEFAKWCIAEKVAVLTVYAFSTENWNRDPAEVAALMEIFSNYCDELRVAALERNIKILVLSTDASRIPNTVASGLSRMSEETKHCDGLVMNICMSYGSRGEILEASRALALDAVDGVLDPDQMEEHDFEQRLLTSHCGDPDVLIRTSGEVRVSNFLLWQLAYAEMFFIKKPWPAVDKEDLLEVIRTYAKGRDRRFGK